MHLPKLAAMPTPHWQCGMQCIPLPMCHQPDRLACHFRHRTACKQVVFPARQAISAGTHIEYRPRNLHERLHTQAMPSPKQPSDHPRRRAWAVALLCALVALPAPSTAFAQTQITAGTLALHQPIPTLHLKDQHDQPWTVPADTRLVLLATGRKASSLVQAVLEKEPKEFLAQRRTVYVADMSKMPSFATRMFALPSLREMPFRVGVSLEEPTLAAWPREADAVTLIELANGVVQRIASAKTEADLKAALTR